MLCDRLLDMGRYTLWEDLTIASVGVSKSMREEESARADSAPEVTAEGGDERNSGK